MKDYKLSKVAEICENQDDCLKCEFYIKLEDGCGFKHMPMLWNVEKKQTKKEVNNEKND